MNKRDLNLSIGCHSVADSDLAYQEFLMEVLRLKAEWGHQQWWVELVLRGKERNYTSLKLSDKPGHGFSHCSIVVTLPVREGVIPILGQMSHYASPARVGFALNGLWDDL
jgi:hypothetical protein